jgi:hypothetical protein
MFGLFGGTFKISLKPILKIVAINWYGEITLKIVKTKSIKSIRIKAHLDISIMYQSGTKFLSNKIKSFQKDF